MAFPLKAHYAFTIRHFHIYRELQSAGPLKFQLRLSGEPDVTVSGLHDVAVASSLKTETALVEWTVVDSRLCKVRNRGSCVVSRLRMSFQLKCLKIQTDIQ